MHAFQATFLILLRKAQSIRNRDSLASWLFGVAMRAHSSSPRHAHLARRA
jgi:DNA-directed RNA polymerase specialized sigma24 family protein